MALNKMLAKGGEKERRRCIHITHTRMLNHGPQIVQGWMDGWDDMGCTKSSLNRQVDPSVSCVLYPV